MREDRERVLMRVTPHGLMPADELTAQVLARYPVDAEIEVTLFRKVSPRILRLLYSVLEEILPSTDYLSKDDLVDHLKICLGLISGYETMGNTVRAKPGSLTSYDHDEVSRFVEASFHLIETEVIPGLNLTPLIDKARTKMTTRRFR
jgi:hypothetical protein